MRLMVMGLALLVSGTVWAGSPLAPGSFAGRGTYLGPDGSAGCYEVSASVEPGTLTCTDLYADGQGGARRETVTLEFADDGTFAVRGSSGEPGQGRCDAGLCSYAMEFPGGRVMELLRFTQDGIERVGRKSFSSMSVSWSETLTRVP